MNINSINNVLAVLGCVPNDDDLHHKNCLAKSTVREMSRLLVELHDYVCEEGSFASEWSIADDLRKFFNGTHAQDVRDRHGFICRYCCKQ